MKSSKVQTLCVCGCCKRSLPASAFYINKKTGLPGNYCKECRKTVSRNHRKNEKRSLACDRESSYPVITSTEDPTLRRELILPALETAVSYTHLTDGLLEYFRAESAEPVDERE